MRMEYKRNNGAWKRMDDLAITTVPKHILRQAFQSSHKIRRVTITLESGTVITYRLARCEYCGRAS